MTKHLSFTLLFAITVAYALVIGLGDAPTAAMAASSKEASDDIRRVRTELQKMIPSADYAEIVATAADGVYRIDLEGSYAFVYVDGDYVLFGDLYDTARKINIGDQARNARMVEVINAVPTTKMITFAPQKTERYITVFTDIDCGYCRKLHNEVAQLNEAGIEVRYLAFPRSGIGNASYNKYVSVWCSDDQQSAMTAAKAGQSPAPLSCENPIAESYKLGQRVGVTGTPTIIFDDGTVVPGYQPAKLLIEQLGLADKS
ncbi:MAG: DsbC family protein [Gammaproteobacteria bacterium]|nr:DsbC family protein [Gammaproteobacteria bacterium]